MILRCFNPDFNEITVYACIDLSADALLSRFNTSKKKLNRTYIYFQLNW